jgi:hypothetical protein
MPRVSVHFRESFRNDAILVHVDGQVRQRLAGVTTKLLLGFAEILELPVEAGAHLLEIELADRGVRAALPLEATGDLHVEAWYDGRRLDLQLREEPPAYL